MKKMTNQMMVALQERQTANARRAHVTCGKCCTNHSTRTSVRYTQSKATPLSNKACLHSFCTVPPILVSLFSVLSLCFAPTLQQAINDLTQRLTDTMGAVTDDSRETKDALQLITSNGRPIADGFIKTFTLLLPHSAVVVHIDNADAKQTNPICFATFSDGKYEEGMASGGAHKEAYEEGIFKQYFLTVAASIEGMERPIGLLFHGGKYQAAVLQQARYA